MTDFLAIQRR